MFTFPLGKEAVFLRQTVKLPRPPRQLLPSQVLTFPLGKEATQWHLRLPRQGALLPPKEGSRQAGALLPPGEGSSLVPSPASQTGLTFPLLGENSSQAGNNPLTSEAGSQVTRSSRKNPRCSARQRALQASQGISTASQAGSSGTWDANLTPNPPIGSLKGLPQKTPTLSGSLTFPANL